MESISWMKQRVICKDETTQDEMQDLFKDTWYTWSQNVYYTMYQKSERQFFLEIVHSCFSKALTGLDRESAHPLQLHAVKWSCCTDANIGGTGRLSPWVDIYGGSALYMVVMQRVGWFPSKSIIGLWLYLFHLGTLCQKIVPQVFEGWSINRNID